MRDKLQPSKLCEARRYLIKRYNGPEAPEILHRFAWGLPDRYNANMTVLI